jgi:hypothetical protein
VAQQLQDFAISERWLVWRAATPAGSPGLYAYDLWTAAEPALLATVPPVGLFESSFDVSGDRIAWVEVGGGLAEQVTARLVVHDQITGETTPVIEIEGVISPIDLDGSALAYIARRIDWDRDRFATLTIEVVDLDTGTTSSVSFDDLPFSFDAFTMTTDGRSIIFSGPYWSLGHNIDRETWFMLPVRWYAVDLDDGFLTWAVPHNDMNGPTELHVAAADDFASGSRSRHFPETGDWLSLGFLRFWDDNGGVPVFGYPTTWPEFHRSDSGDLTTHQWTERQRLEWHHTDSGTVYEIQLGRLGAELLDQQGRDWRAFPTADPASPHYFAVTGHAIAPEFWDYWSDHGLDLGDRGVSFRESVALFGYPLSEPMMETNADGDTVLTQYFERAVFEYHPSNPVEWQVLLRRVGAEVLAERGW